MRLRTTFRVFIYLFLGLSSLYALPAPAAGMCRQALSSAKDKELPDSLVLKRELDEIQEKMDSIESLEKGIIRLEKLRDRLARFNNGDSTPIYQVKRRNLWRNIKLAFQQGNTSKPLDLARPILRGVEVPTIKYLYFKNKIQLLKNLSKLKPFEQITRDAQITELQKQIDKALIGIGEGYGDYVFLRTRLEDFSFLNRDAAELLPEVSVSKTDQQLTDVMAIAIRSARNVSEKLSVEKLGPAFPAIGPELSRPTIEVIRQIFATEKIAKEAMLRKQLRQEVLSTIRFFVTFGIESLRHTIVKLVPESVTIPAMPSFKLANPVSIPLRSIFHKAMLLSRDKYQRDTYLHRIEEIDEANGSYAEKLLMLQQDSAGPSQFQEEFLLTFARLPHVRKTWEELKKVAETTDPHFLSMMKVAEDLTKLPENRNLAIQETVAPRQVVATVGAAIATGSYTVLEHTPFGPVIYQYLEKVAFFMTHLF